MYYTLFNKATNKPLKIPTIKTTWVTENLQEAEEMLDACLEYIDAIGANCIKDDIIIIDADCLEV